MKACFNTITAGRDKPLEEIIDACGSVGFSGIEIDLNHLEAASERLPVKAIKDRLAAANLEPAAIMAFDLAPLAEDEVALDRFKRGVEAAHAFGSPVLLVYCATNIPKGMSAEEAKEKAGRRAATYAELANPIKVGLEPIGRTTLMGTPEAALEIEKSAGAKNVGVVMDTFHFYKAGVTDIRPYPVQDFLMIHLNDAENLPVEQLKDANRLHLGLGILPLRSYLKTIKDKKYAGFLSIEIFRPEYWEQPVVRVVTDAKQSFDRILAELGEV